MKKIFFYNPLDYLYYKIAVFNNRHNMGCGNIRNFENVRMFGGLLAFYSACLIVSLDLPIELSIVFILLIYMAMIYVRARRRKIFRKYIGES